MINEISSQKFLDKVSFARCGRITIQKNKDGRYTVILLGEKEQYMIKGGLKQNTKKQFMQLLRSCNHNKLDVIE